MDVEIITSFALQNNMDLNFSHEVISQKPETIANPQELVIKSMYLEELGKYGMAVDFAKYAIQALSASDLWYLGAKISLEAAKMRSDFSYQITKSGNQIEGLIDKFSKCKDTFTDLDNLNFLYFIAFYYDLRSQFDYFSADYLQALEWIDKLDEIWEKVEDDNLAFRTEVNRIYNLVKIGKISKAKSNLSTIQYKYKVAKRSTAYYNLAFVHSEIYVHLSDYQSALNVLVEVYQDALKYNLENMKIHSERYLAKIYARIGKFTKANILQQQVLKFYNSMTNPYYLSIIYDDLGETARLQGKYLIAMDMYQKAIEQAEIMRSNDLIIESLFHLLLAEVESEPNQKHIQGYYKQIKSKILKCENPIYNKLPLLCEALVMYCAPRISDKFRAFELFNALINEDDVYFEYQLIAIYYSIFLLLKEYQIKPNPEIIEELNNILNHLRIIANDLGSNAILKDYYLLLAKLDSYRHEFQSAKKHLHKAREVASSLESDEILNFIEFEERVVSESKELGLRLSQPDFGENPEISDLMDYVKYFQRRKSLTSSTIHQINPILLMIISPGGLNLYAYEFDDSITSELNLMASFLSAMSSFSKELFKKQSEIEVIKIGDQKLMIEQLENFFITYVYQGNSGMAIKQIKEFNDLIIQSDGLYNSIVKNAVSKKEKSKLNIITEHLFIEDDTEM